jgi:myogenesis-regulating glycosidase
VIKIDNGYKIRTTETDEIAFTIDVDTESFSSLYVKRKFSTKESIVQDCLPFEDKVNWYGGPQQMDQRYPVQKFEFKDYAYLTKELESAAIMERYWFSTKAFFILIDYEAPLFIDQNSEKICFTAKKKLPFYVHNESFDFNYRIGTGKSIREMHVNVINRMLGKPSRLPDEKLIRYPIWNTWVHYGRPINETLVEEYAQNVVDLGFKRSLLDIDDFWEDCYGSLIVNTTNFGNLRALTQKLKSDGFIVGMWVHPFVNNDCQPAYNYGVENEFFVKSHSGSVSTSWWNSEKDQAAHVNFAKPAAMDWFRTRLETIRTEFGVDIFKFDAGETTW